jgi:hypothetical protein
MGIPLKVAAYTCRKHSAGSSCWQRDRLHNLGQPG